MARFDLGAAKHGAVIPVARDSVTTETKPKKGPSKAWLFGIFSLLGLGVYLATRDSAPTADDWEEEEEEEE